MNRIYCFCKHSKKSSMCSVRLFQSFVIQISRTKTILEILLPKMDSIVHSTFGPAGMTVASRVNVA